MAVIERGANEVTEKWGVDSSVCDLQFSPAGDYLLAATPRGVFVFETENWKKSRLSDWLFKHGN